MKTLLLILITLTSLAPLRAATEVVLMMNPPHPEARAAAFRCGIAARDAVSTDRAFRSMISS